jgi:pimeloyl-ACP methyl ester carboxylesterase
MEEKMQRRFLLALIALTSACSSPRAPAGELDGACYPNQTCNAGLACQAGRCVPTAAGDTGPSASDGSVATDQIAADAGLLDQALADLAPIELVWGPCSTTDWPTGYPTPSSEVECTTLDAPLDYGNPNGKTIALRVGRHKSKSFPTGRAVFNLAGGPGGAALYQAGTIPMYMAGLRESYDLIYVDQRGTGGSGLLDCAQPNPDQKSEMIACAALHANKDLSHYLTVDAAHDLDLVRKRLGYDKIYLRGGSYGTRLGLEYLRQHEKTVAAIVLDGLAPPDWDFFNQIALDVDQALKGLISECSADPACLAASPSLASDLEARAKTLELSPRLVTVGGKTAQITKDDFALILYQALDRQSSRYKVPRAIHQAQSGDNTAWNALMSQVFGMTITDAASDPAPRIERAPIPARQLLPAQRRARHTLSNVPYVAPGLFIAVLCAEWLPNSAGIDALKQAAASSIWGRTDAVERAEACSAWNVGPLSAALRAAVVSPGKALLLSGAVDIRTPPALGDHALKTLSNGTHLVVPYASHSTISHGCVAQIILDFFNAEGEMAQVSTSCLGALTHPPW